MALVQDARPGADLRTGAVKAALEIDGWLTSSEAELLYDLAKSSEGPIVEIGSFQGRSTTAIALGSMHGRNQPVYAIDPFIGTPPSERKTAKGNASNWGTCSKELLRANLDNAGINGQVTIIAKPSYEAAQDVPECSLLFIDGAHDYESVLRDIQLYLPKVCVGGTVVFHDATAGDPGVVQAIDETVMSYQQHWAMRGRVGSALMAVRKAPSESHNVALMFPGPSACFGSVKALMTATLGSHVTKLFNAGRGWDDFNVVWCDALNAYESGTITHACMIHSDIMPDPGWLDVLLCEMDRLGADLVSVVAPLKDNRGVTSSGVGDVSDRWSAFRRWTMRELFDMPETFSLADTEYADDPTKYLLHNTGCWVADLRNPKFRTLDANGDLMPYFPFPTRCYRNAQGKWESARESEDWYFSRILFELGMKSYCTRKVRLAHRGTADYPNSEPWGTYREGDKDTKHKWGVK